MAKLGQALAGMDTLEQLALNDSPVHRLHPMAKLIMTALFVVTVVSFPSRNVSGLVPFLLFPFVLMPLSGTPCRPLLGRLIVALPFSLMGGISNLVFMRDTAFSVGGFAVSMGLLSFVSIMLKTLLTVLAVLLLIATTSFADICYELTVLRLPNILCLQLVMTYRYVFTLISEAASMFTAYGLRAPNESGVKMGDMGCFLGQLILRSFDRAERVYQAMKCRGFHGVYVGKKRDGFRLSDGLFAGLSALLLFALRFYNISLFFGRLVG